MKAGFEFEAFVNCANEWTVKVQEGLTAPEMKGAMSLVYGQDDQGAVSVFTGLVLQPPKGHAVLIRNPSNLGYERPWRLQEAIIEDWCSVPIWLRLKLDIGQRCKINSDTVLAQLTVVPLSSLRQPQFREEQGLTPDVQRFVDGYYDLKRSEKPKNSRCYHQARAGVKAGTCPFYRGGEE